MSPEILAAIPHRPPMLLIDEIVERGEGQIVCKKTFRAEEFFFQGHYPDFPIVPGVILCEAAMQAGAVLLSGHIAPGEKKVPVAGRLRDVKFKRMVRPGETILIDDSLNERVQDAFFLSAKVTVEGKLAATLSFVVTLAATLA
ncbi:MAG: beta-hydroxyacyl-ACP dehydratase [Planctomycetales bacterium]|nr:beta-hydroxyacyl-ACP dehydratase [Planctomycetales bacterium]